MNVLVSDTSIIIDLERSSLLREAFALPVQFVVPDLLYERELRDHGGPGLIDLGLRVESLEEADVQRAQHYRLANSRLALPDTFALALARSRSWILLTGDGLLRSLALAENVECHGVLWLIDRMHAKCIATAATLHAGLQSLAGHPRCRLPHAEIAVRLEALANQIRLDNVAASAPVVNPPEPEPNNGK